MDSPQSKLDILRHSTAHVLAAAVLEMFPEANFGIGPNIDNGFYYDFDLPRTLIPEDLPLLEEKMRAIIKSNHPFEQSAIDAKKAVQLFQKAKQNYKVELINDLVENEKSKEVTIYKSGPFVDLCRGPHLDSTGEINPDAFKLTSIAGAYWRGDAKNKMLQRIYGVAFTTKQELDNYLKMIEEAEKRDHRKLGKELDLFVFSEIVGKGLPLLTPKGTVIRKELEKFVLEEETKRGYQHVITPHLAKVELYKKSGHYPYYKETMYPIMKVDEEELILRPMTCPHHFELYNSKPRSYKELPVRLAEIASQFRYEKSGELSGLTRVRLFCLADAHIICAKEQADDEIKNVLDLIDYANKIFGLAKGKDYRYRLSLGDKDDNKKYYKDDAAWEMAEGILRNTLKKIDAPYFEAKGEAAFYGPKIDVQMKKVNGQEETAFTVQYDFVMPKRFEMKYIDRDGKEKEPIVIHRSSIGCFERTMAFLIEHYAGAFPVWLAPEQVWILPISEKHTGYANTVADKLRSANIRVIAKNESETIGKKIREGEIQKIPYLLVVGDKEIAASSIAVRQRGQGDLGAMKLEGFIEKITKEIKEKL
ncbi:threonine--tRNA ligase [Patescibacteria group bacterium]|nr:threonine--tRNA ligase [Patescibacteria group bacterium]MBU2265041.1 threonine--tRNA ligase [Patescibacteria group bacterium]